METYNDIYLKVRKSLKSAGVEACEMEARLILASATCKSREEMPEVKKTYATDPKIKKKINESVRRRLTGEPIAYVLGEWEFYGISIAVNENVLIPRVDTEILARETINLLSKKPWQTRLLDLCTGSGCVGLAVAANVPGCRIVMADKSEQALAVCRANMIASNLSRNTKAIAVDVLKAPPSLLGAFDVIVSNPPYIPTADLEILDSSVKDYEPHEALDGGEEGLDYIRSIAEKWRKLLKKGGSLALECGVGQAATVRYIMKKNNFTDIKIYKDTLGIERVLIGTIQ